MATYFCTRCKRLLDIEGMNDRDVVMFCVNCNTALDWKLLPNQASAASASDEKPAVKPGKQEVAVASVATPPQPSKEAVELWDIISKFRGGAVEPKLHPVENILYNLIAAATAEVIESVTGDLPAENVSEMAVRSLVSAADASGKAARLIFEKPVVQCVMYRISSALDLVRLVRTMGQDPLAENRSRLLWFKFGEVEHKVYITNVDHYAWPLVLNGAPCNLAAYNHDYDKLMSQSLDAETQLALLKSGDCWDMNVLAVSVANLVCEADRNWTQLLLNLMLLVAKKTSTTGAKAQGDFPMAGGGWKNHCTWGPGSNRGSAGATDDIRRWMVKVMLTNLGTPDSWKRRLTELLSKDDARESAELASLRKSVTTALGTWISRLG
jgi:hypothetical protein